MKIETPEGLGPTRLSAVEHNYSSVQLRPNQSIKSVRQPIKPSYDNTPERKVPQDNSHRQIMQSFVDIRTQQYKSPANVSTQAKNRKALTRAMGTSQQRSANSSSIIKLMQT